MACKVWLNRMRLCINKDAPKFVHAEPLLRSRKL